MKLSVEITKVEVIAAGGYGGRGLLEVTCERWLPERLVFRVPRTPINVRAYTLGRKVELELSLVRP